MNTTSGFNNPYLTDDETQRFLTEVVGNSESGLLEAELKKAFEQFLVKVLAARNVTWWRDGKIAAAWDEEHQQLVWVYAQPAATTNPQTGDDLAMFNVADAPDDTLVLLPRHDDPSTRIVVTKSELLSVLGYAK